MDKKTFIKSVKPVIKVLSAFFIVISFQNCGGFKATSASGTSSSILSSPVSPSPSPTPIPAPAPPPTSSPAQLSTKAGVLLPSGFVLKQSDMFGTSGNINSVAALHAKYYEGQYYNRDANGKVRIPNVVINNEQQTYQHFENSNVFKFNSDRLTIQGRGQPDGSIQSGEIVSKFEARSWCVEARYKIPSANKSWPAFWQYASVGTSADGLNNDGSEVDVEQPITDNQGVNHVTMLNHGATETEVTILNSDFTKPYMTYYSTTFDASAAPHYYTSCYDDRVGELTRYIDGKVMYKAKWKWNQSLGGTGKGPDASTIFNLAVGGVWPGNHPNPSSYSGDLDLYSLEYFGL
ncbi:MAG: glycoside hydrolase family 16 protein [Bdellovibrionota bacterium]